MKNRSLNIFILTLFQLFWIGCGGASFGGDQSNQTGSGDGGFDTPRFQNNDNIFGHNLTGDQQAISNCIDKWGSHPFSNEQIRNYRKINASVQVFGVGKPLVDEQVTNGPALILVGAAVNVLSPQTRYVLQNPNGWYCLKVDVNVASNTSVDLHCRAKIMDSKTNVSVLSDADATGNVGVSVLSNVKLNRTGNGC